MYERAQSLMCIPFMPVQSCDLIRASDWHALYVAWATRDIILYERELGMRLCILYLAGNIIL